MREIVEDEIKIIRKESRKIVEVNIKKDVYSANTELANENQKIFESNNVLAIDIMGSIGAGKTTLLENVVQILRDKYKILMIGGDVATSIDAERIKQHHVDVIQINAGCHLDANLIQRAIKEVDLKEVEILLIENVGNLICPSGYELGTKFRMCVVSVTEGPYMIKKHPFIIGNSDVVVINKIELAEAMEVDPNQLKEDVHKINPRAKVVFANAKRGEGVEEVIRSLGIEF